MKAVHVVGGLGSQMLAYSLYLALKNKYTNERVICDFTAMHKYGHICHNGEELTRVFGIQPDYLPIYFAPIIYSKNIFFRILRKFSRVSGLIKFHDAMQKNYNYDESVFYQKGNVIYHQCWTSYKYFLGIENQIKKAFKFKPLKDLKNVTIHQKIISENSVSVHVRRGDYVGKKFSGGLVDNFFYYRKAFEIIKQKIKNPNFFIFSNDPEWVEKNLIKEIHGAPVAQIEWNSGNDSYIDMQLMASCRHHIIANSGFSWMGAYLAQSDGQIVVAPKNWSGDLSTGIELRDMNLPNWIEIDN